jgi:glycosyltransferase involved in cell wall biosynthesis
MSSVAHHILNVLIISSSFSPDVGGIETHLQDLISFLKKRRHKITVLTFKPYQSYVAKVKGVERKAGVTIFRIPRICRSIFFVNNRWHPAGQFFYLPMLAIFSFLFILLHRKEIDIIHVHGILPTPIACLISKMFRKKIIMSLHFTYIPRGKISKTIARIIFSLTDKILCLSNKSKSELLKIGLESEKVEVFTYWVDLALFKPLDKAYYKKFLGFNDKFVVLFVGRLIEEKGVKILLTVAKKCNEMFNDILFVVIGLGPLAREVINASKDLKNLRYQGAIDNKNLPVYYNAADVVVVPSISEEGFGRVILESLACGTPVIASNRGGIPEALNSSVGILIEPTAESLANAIIRLYNNRNELIKLASNCRVYAQRHFSEDNAKLIEATYYALLKTKNY